MPKLIYLEPETGSQVVVELNREMPEVTIGRNPGNIIRINNPSVSRRHTKFVYEGGQCTLYDLNSSNGSYVNGIRIQSQVLEDGDLVRVGEFPLEFVDDLSPAQPRVEANSPSPKIESMRSKPMSDSQSGSDAAIELVDQLMDAFILEEGDIQEVVPENRYPMHEEDGFISDRIDGGPVIAESVAAPRSGQLLKSIGELGHNQRPEGRGVNLQSWEQGLDTVDAEDLDHTAAAPPGLVTGMVMEMGSEASGAPEVERGPGFGSPAGASSEESNMLRAQIKKLEQRNEELVRSLDEGLKGAGDVMVDRLRSERDRLSGERAGMVRQIEDLRAKLEAAPTDDDLAVLINAREEAFKETKELRKEVASLTASLKESADGVAGLQAENGALHEELEAALDELQLYQQSREVLDSERSALGGEVQRLEKEVAALRQARDYANERVEMLQDELARCDEEMNNLRGEVGGREARIQKLSEEIRSVRGDLERRDERIEELLTTLAERETERDQAWSQVAELQSELERRPAPDEAAAMSEEVEELRQKLQASRDLVTSMEAEVHSLQTRQAELEQFSADLEARHARISQERDALRGERDSFKQEKVAYARETDYLQMERRKQADQLAELQAQVAMFDKERAKKKKIFAELSNDLRGLVTENERLGSKVAELEQTLESGPSTEEVAKLRADIEERDQLLAQLEAQVEELENDSSTLTRDLGEIGEERNQLEGRLEALEEELKALREAAQDGDDLESRLAEVVQEKSTIQEERDVLAGEKEELRQRLKELEVQLEDSISGEEAAAQVNELTQELEAIREELATVVSAREEVEEKLAALEEAVAGEEVANDEAHQKLVEEKMALEEALAAMIRERDQLEDELRQFREAT